jgi:hypothetical protein
MLWRKPQRTGTDQAPIVALSRQLKRWRRANRRMGWGIPSSAFLRLPPPPVLTPADRAAGFAGVILSYGFDSGYGPSADAVLSGKRAWDYVCRRWQIKTWQCRYIDFDQADHMRLRPGAPARPRGFYYAKLKMGADFIHWPVARFRRQLPPGDTGCGPEGVQLLAVTHPGLAAMMNRRRMPFMAFADYDVAPHGFNDFYDALQMFCSNDTLGLGIGNVDRTYPLFGIPSLRLSPPPARTDS